MIDAKTIADVWPLILSMVFLVVWCIRLESKVMYLEKDHDNHKISTAEANKVMWAKLDGLQTTLNLVLQAVGELKGKVENN